MAEARIAAAAPRTGGYPWYVLGVLTLAYTIGFIDRQILNLLVQPIKAEFRLSDVQISLLQGLAFSGAYMIVSPVFGRWVDLSNRRNILFGAVVVWSLFTAVCGLARSFWSLFLARTGVGAAEAGLTPAAWSILSDTFDNKTLPRAFSLYMIGPYLGGGLALLFGGLILKWVAGTDYSWVPGFATAAPWQMTFVLISLPGILCALLLLLVREPSRHGGAEAVAAMPLGEVSATLLGRRRFYGFFYLGMACSFIPLYAIPAWMPAYAMRRFDVGITEVGVDYGLITIVSGIVGVLSGPTLGRWLAARGHTDASLRLVVFTSIAIVLCCAGIYWGTSYRAVLLSAGLAGLCYSAPASLAATALQLAAPNRMRGMTSAIYVFIATVAGLFLAPTLVAFITDHVFGDEARVGESLAIVCALSAVLSAIFISLCLPAYRRLLVEQHVISPDGATA